LSAKLQDRYTVDHRSQLAVLNKDQVGTEKLSSRHILSVRCPMCRAKPKQPCTLSTGHPSAKTHLAREQAAARMSPPETLSQRAIKVVKNLNWHSIRLLFQHK
jgi:hypothetical protein